MRTFFKYIFKAFCLACFTCLFSLQAMSQDTLFFKSGLEKPVWITVKSDKEVKYKIMDTDDSPVIIDKTAKIDRIVFRNGEEVIVSARLKRMPDRHGISAGIMAGGSKMNVLYKLHLNYFTKPAINFTLDILKDVENEANGFFAGIKYYYNPHKEGLINAYSGLSVGSLWEELTLQIPLGISLAAKKGFDIKLGINTSYAPVQDDYDLYGEILLGWRL